MYTTDQNLNEFSKYLKSNPEMETLNQAKLFESEDKSQSQNSFEMNLLISSSSKQSVKLKKAKILNEDKNRNEMHIEANQKMITNPFPKKENIIHNDQSLISLISKDLEKKKALALLLESNDTFSNSFYQKEINTKDIEKQTETRSKNCAQSNEIMYINTEISLITQSK